MGLQTDMYPSHGFKQQQQSYYNDNDYYSSEDNHYSNNGSSMQMKKPHGYPTPLPTQNHRMMMSHGGYSHDEDSWYNKDKFQTSNGHYNSNSQYGHMSHDSANISSYGFGMQHSGGYGSGTHHSSHANGGYGRVVFNTAKVGCQTSVVNMAPVDMHPTAQSPKRDIKPLQWEVFKERAGVWGVADFTLKGFVDHINTTKDSTDYLWYTTSIFVNEEEEFIRKGTAMLSVESKGHAMYVFINKKLQASASGNGTVPNFKFGTPITLKAGKNEIALLSMTVGLQTAGSFYEWIGAGPTSVKVEGFKSGTLDLSAYSWTYKIGLQGEHLRIHKSYNLNSKIWAPTSEPPKQQPLTWYKAVVDAPPGNEPVALDMIHMGKGMAWLNGQEIGRYWPRKASKYEKCVTQCDYRGKFNPDKCVAGCGEPSQRWYHVPRSWFKPSGNVLIIFEETGGDPSQIRFSVRKVSGACGHLSEDHPSFDVENLQGSEIENNKNRATLRLKCPTNTNISAVKFASFGNPNGTCGSYMLGDCHDPNSASVVEKVCLNQNECALEMSSTNFNMLLCPSTVKRLAVEVNCS